jgi:DNA processing protein
LSLLHQVALTFIKNVGPSLAKSLLTHFGSAEQIFKTRKTKLVDVPGLGEKRVSDLGFSAALYAPKKNWSLWRKTT